MRVAGMTAVVVALLITAGACTSSNEATSSAVRSPPTTTAPTVSRIVTEFGATDDVWNSHHSPAPGLKAGSAYDPDPSLPPLNGQAGPRYTFVVHDKAHIIQLVRALPSGASIDEARGYAMQELPSDADVLWFAVKDSCAQMETQSAALAQALSANGDGGGFALAEFTTLEPDGKQDYKPGHVGGFRMTTSAASTPSDAPPC